MYSGKPEEAIRLINKAMRLTPIYPSWYLTVLGTSYRMKERFEEAIATYREALRATDEGFFAFAAFENLAFLYAELGDQEKARDYVARLLELRPNYSLEQLERETYYKNPADLQRFKAGLRRVGVPEHPP